MDDDKPFWEVRQDRLFAAIDKCAAAEIVPEFLRILGKPALGLTWLDIANEFRKSVPERAVQRAYSKVYKAWQTLDSETDEAKQLFTDLDTLWHSVEDPVNDTDESTS
jgi:hypothetical protein